MAEDKTAEDELSRVAWINRCLREAKMHTAQWRRDTREAYDFRAGKQWNTADAAAMEAAGKVPIVFNRIERTVRAVVGLEIQNRQEVRYQPRGVEDSAINELYSSAADWIRDNCDAEDEESESFQDLVTCGMGWTCTELDYEEEQNGKVVIERTDPLDMFWDASARKKNIRDARWIAHVKRVSRQDIVEQWPAFDSMSPQDKVERLLDDDDQPHDATPPFYEKDSEKASQPKVRELICFQWWERETYHRLQLPDGREFELSQVKFDALAPSLEAMGIQHVEQKRRKYVKAYIADGVLLEEKPLAVQKSGYTYKCMTGARDRNANTYFGLVNLMMDPQRFANKWLSQITHILNKSAKGGLVAEMDAFANPKNAEATWAKAENITWTNPGAVSGNKLMPKPETPFPEGYGKLLEFAISSINDVPGVSVELLGLTGRDQPGVLEDMRKKAGVTILAVFFDSIRLYRKDQGRLMIEYIRKYLSDGRLIRIVGKEGAKYVPLMRDERALEFDVVVDESPTSPNNKERTFALLTSLAPALKDSGIPLTPAIIEYSPLPSKLVEEWKTYIKENKQLPPEVQQAMQQLQQTVQAQQGQIGKLAADNQKMEVDKSVEIYKITQQAEVDRQIAAMKSATETEKRGVEMYKANLEAMMEKMSLIADAVSSNMRATVDSAMPRTEQAVGKLGDSLIPALNQIMAVSQAQMMQWEGMPQHFEALGERIARAIADAVKGARVIESEQMMDPSSGRVVGLRRRFASGDEDMMPIKRGATIQ